MPHDSEADEPQAEFPVAGGADKKTAIVIVHGMGEQRPMETLWGFVDAVWSRDKDLVSPRNAALYSKPDPLFDSFELRRVTTRHAALENGAQKRADFFEFYWAHLMTGNTVQSFARWFAELLLRRPSSVPPRLRAPWLVGLALLAIAALFAAAAAAQAAKVPALDPLFAALPTWALSGLAAMTALFSLFAATWLAPVAGDAARYLSPEPGNVAARQQIRQSGVQLLEKLTQSGRYDRIVLVGHSLGSVIAYDVLNFAWGRIAEETWRACHPQNGAAMAALTRLETAAGKLQRGGGDPGELRRQYRALQREYHAALAANADPPWLVSDFVSLGAPLSKADVLMARDARAFSLKRKLREAAGDPPWLEKNSPSKTRFSYPFDARSRAPHSGAVFAPVVWTNLYYPSFLIVFGDVISGPVADLFGKGVLDVRLPRAGLVFRHLDYWKQASRGASAPWLPPLRKAVNLRKLSDADLWGAEAAAAEVVVSA